MFENVVQLGTLVNRKIGYGIVQPGASLNDGVPVIKVNNIISGLNSIDDLDKTSIEIDRKYPRTKLKGGELVISLVGSVGKTAIIPNSFAGCNLVRATGLIDIEDPSLALWVKYYIDSPEGQRYINSNLNTTVQITLNIKSLVEMPIPLPSREVISKITSILKSLDDKIENNRKINENLEQQAQALFKSWFVDFEPFRDQPFVESELGMIPEGWRVGTIGDYCKIRSGFAFKSSWWTESGCKVIKIKNISDNGELDLNDCSFVNPDNTKKANEFKATAGDLIIAMTGATIGKFNIIPKIKEDYFINQRVGKFFLGDKPLSRLPFIYCILKRKNTLNVIINKGQGSAQPNISGSDIENIPLVVPPVQVIDNFNTVLSPLFDMIISNQGENQSLSQLRDTLLPKLMSGELKI